MRYAENGYILKISTSFRPTISCSS